MVRGEEIVMVAVVEVQVVVVLLARVLVESFLIFRGRNGILEEEVGIWDILPVVALAAEVCDEQKHSGSSWEWDRVIGLPIVRVFPGIVDNVEEERVDSSPKKN